MPLSTDLEILNRALRDISGSFLQYVGEIWPWTSVGAEGDKLRQTVFQCVDRQRHSIQRIAEFLTSRQDRVEFGQFSSEFTDLHYVSLTFLLKKLIDSQTLVVESLNRAVTLLPSGDETHDLLASVCQTEQQNLATLKHAAG